MALTTNLISYWKFDESSGDVLDAHGSNDGTNSGATAGETGQINTAYEFDGSSSVITIPDDDTLDITSGVTISAWVYPTSTASNQIFLAKQAGSTWASPYAVYTIGQASGSYKVKAWVNTNTNQIYSTSSMTANAWNHVVFTYDGTTEKIYINGVQDATTLSLTDTIDTSAYQMSIGSRPSGEYFDGKLDEIGLWDTALTSNEILDLWNSGDGLAYPLLTEPKAYPAAQSLSLTQNDPNIDIVIANTVTPDSQSITLSQQDISVDNGIGVTGTSTIYINNGGTWTLVGSYEEFTVSMKQNQVSDFYMKIPYITDTEKAYVKEFAEVIFLYGEDLILKGRIQKVTYSTSYSCEVTGYGMEAVLLDKEFLKDGDNRVQYTNESAQTIAKELLSSNSDGATPWIMESDGLGLFTTDYGSISMRYEYANRLSSLASLAESMDYEWGISQSPDFDTDYFQLGSLLPTTTRATVSQGNFIVKTISGDTGTAESGGTNTLTDTDQSWTTDEWAGYVVSITAGTGINQYRKVSSNTSDTLTVSSSWDITPSSDSEYALNLNANCSQTSNEKDITNLANRVNGIGYGDGVNQISTNTYNASATFTTLGDSITSTDTTITLTDASAFASSGTIRIMKEIITYTGKSTNDLTGCTRGTSSTDALEHKSGVFVEKYVEIDSAESGSSIADNSLMDYTLTNREIIDVATLELAVSRELLKKLDPIVRITVTPDDPEDTVNSYKIGDMVTISDSEAAIDDSYRIVAITFSSYYGYLSVELQCSNRTLTFIEQMAAAKEAADALSTYMQGSTNIYAISEAENCDGTHPLNMRFFIPNEAIAINRVLLNFKMKDYRAYSTGVTGAPVSQTNSSVWAAANAANWNFGWSSIADSNNFIDNVAYNLDTTDNVLSTSTLYETTDNTFFLPTSQKYDWWVYTDDTTPDAWSDLGYTIGYLPTDYETISSKKIPLANTWSQDTVVDDWDEVDNVLTANPTYVSKSGWVSETSNPDFDIPVLAPELDGTFDKIRISFSYYHGTLTARTISFYLQRSSNQVTWSTVGSWTSESIGIGETFYQTVEEDTDYMGNYYRIKIDNSYVNDSINLSTCIINVETFMKTESEIDYGIEEETLSSPSVTLNVGEDGETLDTIDTYTEDQTEVDITDEVSAVGAGNWMDVEFTPNQNMRIEANAYIQIFIEST